MAELDHDEDDRYSSYSDESFTDSSDYTSSSAGELGIPKCYVTKQSQEPEKTARKESYAGLRDLTDTCKIEEKDIVAADGSIRGVKNRVRAGLANFENREALQLVSISPTPGLAGVGGAGSTAPCVALI
jgi:hypothetical protein